MSELTNPERCESCSERTREQIIAFDHRLLALEIVVRGQDGRNGMKAQLSKLCERFDAFEKEALRVITIATALPGIVITVVAVLKFIGKL
jgi:hypothetical protein